MGTEESYTTIGGWVVAIGKALEYLEEDIQPMLDELSITTRDYINPDYRVSAKKLNRLFDLAAIKVGDPCFGISVARHVHPSTFSVLGYGMLASDTMKEVLLRLSRYKKIVSNTCSLTLAEEQDKIDFIMHIELDLSGQPVLNDALIFTFFATVIKFLRELSNENFSPLSIGFTAKRPAYHHKIKNYFNCEINYCQDNNFVSFDKRSVERKLPTGNAQIAQIHDKVVLDAVAKLDQNDLVAVIQNKILDSLTLGVPNQEDIAKDLNMSLRNLQRKLSEHGTCFKDIVDGSRHDLAIQYVKQNNLSLGEISYLLGFSSVTNFSRAFKRWTNEAPGFFRDHHFQHTP